MTFKENVEHVEEGVKNGKNWNVPIPILLFLLVQGAAGVWWGSDISSRVGALERNAVTQGQVHELQQQVVGLRRDVADNIDIRRRMWDRIERLERVTTAVDERTKATGKTVDRIYDELVKAREAK